MMKVSSTVFWFCLWTASLVLRRSNEKLKINKCQIWSVHNTSLYRYDNINFNIIWMKVKKVGNSLK